MSIQIDTGAAVLGRMQAAYGVKSNAELSEIISVPPTTISNWATRESVPGKYIIACALDTGVDLAWLALGQLKNVSQPDLAEGVLRGKELYESLHESGGKIILQRILMAYGFTMQKQLGDLLGISSGTMSAWVRREYFPGDVVVTCALDTGVSLRWLATGVGLMRQTDIIKSTDSVEYTTLEKFCLYNGCLHKQGSWICDPSLIDASIISPALVEKGESKWITDLGVKALGNGIWLVNIDGVIDVYEVLRLPGNKINIKTSTAEFQCLVDDVECVGKVCFTLSKNN